MQRLRKGDVPALTAMRLSAGLRRITPDTVLCLICVVIGRLVSIIAMMTTGIPPHVQDTTKLVPTEALVTRRVGLSISFEGRE